jgi:hypothetical protein
MRSELDNDAGVIIPLLDRPVHSRLECYAP